MKVVYTGTKEAKIKIGSSIYRVQSEQEIDMEEKYAKSLTLSNSDFIIKKSKKKKVKEVE